MVNKDLIQETSAISIRAIGHCPAKDQTTGVHSRGRRRPAMRILVPTYRSEARLQSLLDNFGVSRCQGVFGRQTPMRPRGRLILGAYSRHLLNQALTKGCRRLFSEDGPC